MTRDVNSASGWIKTFVSVVLGAISNEYTRERLGFQFVAPLISKIWEAFTN